MNSRIFKVNDYDLNNVNNFTIRRIDHFALPAVDIKSANSASVDGGVATNSYYREKPIVVEGEFMADDFMQLSTDYRDLMSKLEGVNKELKFVIDGHNVIYTGTLATVSQAEPKGGYLEIKMTFVCHNPYGTSEGYFTTVDSGVTSDNNTTNLTIGGNTSALPIITIHINSLTVTNPQTVSITSDSGLLTITRAWETGETIVLNSETGNIQVGANNVVYSGRLPELNSGSTSIVYSDEFTSRNVDITIRYKKRWL